MSEQLALFIARSTIGLDLSRGKVPALARARGRMDAAVPGWRLSALGERPAAAVVVMIPDGDDPFVELVLACNPEAPAA